MCTNICMHVCRHTHIHTHPTHMYAHTCIYMHTHAHPNKHVYTCRPTPRHAHTHMHAHIHTHVHAHAYPNMYTHTCSCTHMRVHTYTHACAHVHTQSHHGLAGFLSILVSCETTQVQQKFGGLSWPSTKRATFSLAGNSVAEGGAAEHTVPWRKPECKGHGQGEGTSSQESTVCPGAA